MTICECEECVAARKWIVEKTGVGGGTRPLSFLIASHDYMAAERKKYEVSLKKHIELVDRLVKEKKEALELADDLRCYTHDWDWKYGEEWDRKRAEIAAVVETR